MKAYLLALVVVLCAIPATAQTKAGATKPQKHAIVKLLTAPLAAPKVAFAGIKGTLYGVMFSAEVGVDSVHAAFTVADKVFDTVSANGKIPVLDTVYAVVGTIAADSGKADVWLERQQQGLFGTHN